MAEGISKGYGPILEYQGLNTLLRENSIEVVKATKAQVRGQSGEWAFVDWTADIDHQDAIEQIGSIAKQDPMVVGFQEVRM